MGLVHVDSDTRDDQTGRHPNTTMTNANQTTDETDAEAQVDEPTSDHLDDVEDGCGCTEIWEHMSEQREAAAGDD